MKPTITLLAAFTILTLLSRLFFKDWNLLIAGNLSMCLMLFLTASGHFLFTKGMTMMIPPIIPCKTLLVYLSGLAEVVLGIAILFQSTRFLAGVALIILFLLLLPANIFAAFKHLNIEKGSYTGPGLAYLWFRVPLQLFFILWVYVCTIAN
ncbi:DoxX family protein [Mucilaginibacter antarcticus]|uniref:DoxX-like protein n=1 Tax=Mucilaginibacter antarcticus TaxID=1855725 RepID=A0ABW5XT41_9SPHI